MKNVLMATLFVLAAAGCGTSYMLLRLPEHVVTAVIVNILGVKPCALADSAGAMPATEPATAPAETEEATEPRRARAAGKTVAGAVKVEKSEQAETGDWRGLAADDWYAGKRLSERDFRDKVTLVYVWSSKEKPSVDLLPRIEDLWKSFRSKPLVVVGSHRGGRNPKIPKACSKLGLTFPVYEGAAFVREPSVKQCPYLYVVDHRGKIVYRGGSDRAATEALVEALTACSLGL